MTGTQPEQPDKSRDSPRGGREDERPGPRDWREPGGDVKEPPRPGTAGTQEKFPRKGEV